MTCKILFFFFVKNCFIKIKKTDFRKEKAKENVYRIDPNF